MHIYTENERLEQITNDRRALHRIPEVGYDLFKTRAYLMRALEEMQPDMLERCDEGIKVVFRAPEAKTGAIAFRADMDALPVAERTCHDFPSGHPGTMHACGHDGHMAAMLMLARIVAGRKSELARDVVIIFQAAEENLGGAKRMIEAGVMRDPTVEEVYGLHIMPTLPVGVVGSCVGPLMASVDTIEIEMRGKAAHGATPQLGTDAVMAMAAFLVNVQDTLTRRIGPMEPTVFTVGCVQSGNAFNIVSERSVLKGSLRSFKPEVRERALEIIRDALAAADLLYGTVSEMRIVQTYPAVVNHEECVAKVRMCAGEAYRTLDPVTIAEDFSEFELVARGAYFFCGCADETHRELLHSQAFDFDERALLTGVEIFEKLVFGGAE